MEAIKTLIVDDEPLARETLRLLLSSNEQVVIAGECKNGQEAVDTLLKQDLDLVFLDIQMPEMNGFEVIEAVGAEKMPVVIFVTAYDQYALQAFEARALDYLLKPFDDERFEQALQRAFEQIHQRQVGELSTKLVDLIKSTADQQHIEVRDEPVGGSFLERIMIKERGSIFFVKVDEIDWIEAAGDYVSLNVGAKSHLVRETMSGLMKKLNPRQFVRVHRSSIVKVDSIRELKPYFHGDYIITLKNGKELKLSRRYWDQVEKVLGN